MSSKRFHSIAALLLLATLVASAARVRALSSDSVQSYETKIQIGEQDVDKIKTAFGMNQSEQRTLYFLDNEKHELFNAGLIVRLRQSGKDDYEVIVKVRPLDSTSMGRYKDIATSAKFKWEYGEGKEVLQAKIKQFVQPALIEKILEGDKKGGHLLTHEQRRALMEKAASLTEDGHLKVNVYGPIKSSYFANANKDQIEVWTLPNGEKISELSHAGKDGEHAQQMARLKDVLEKNNVEEVHDVLKSRRAIDVMVSNKCIVRQLKLRLAHD